MQTQIAIVASKLGKASLRRTSRPHLKSSEAILKVRKAGICGTDLATISGSYKIRKPVILGHELVAEVHRIRKGVSRSSLPEGTRVVTEINVPCGSCALCRSDLRNHCANIETIGMTRDGGFGEYLSAPLANLHLIPDSISDDEAVFVEPLAAAIQITKMSDIRRGSTVAVVGTGRLGLLVLQVLGLRKPKRLAAFAHRDDRRADLARSFGAEVFTSSHEPDAVARQTGGVGFDHVIEASGSPSGLDVALNLVRPRGTIHLKSTHGKKVELDPTILAVRELKIQGSRCGPFGEAIRMLEQGKVSVSKFVSARFALGDYEEAFRKAGEGSTIKVLFDVG